MTEPNKKVFFEIHMKKGLNEEKLNSDWNEEQKKLEELGTYSEKTVARRLTSKYVRLLNDNSESFEGIIIGYKDNDYGATWKYREARRAYENNPEEAIKQGLVNEEGQPLNQSGFNKGSPIDLDKCTTREYIGVFAKQGESFVEGILRDYNLETIPPLFTKVSFRAKITKNDSTQKRNLMFCATTQFEPLKELSEKEVNSFLKETYPGKLAKFSDVKKVAENFSTEYDEFCIFKADVVSFIDSERTRFDAGLNKNVKNNNVLNVTSPDVPDSLYACYAPHDMKFNVQEYALDIILVGRPSYNQNTDKVVMNLYGYYVAPSERAITKEYVEPQEEQKEFSIPEEKNSLTTTNTVSDGSGWA